MRKQLNPHEMTYSFSFDTLFFLSVRSIESFERKLEDTQKSLNIPVRDFIPVLYHNEVDLASTHVQYSPYLIFAGKLTTSIPRFTIL